VDGGRIVSSTPLRILLIGKTGQVGFEANRTLATIGDVIALDYPEIDLADAESIRLVVRATAPTLIVNTAAYTSVDKAEAEPDVANAVNGIAPGILAKEAKNCGAAIIHYSTDYVYDGKKQAPYVETDETNPLSVYGRTKLSGDEAVAAAGAPYLIFRTSWVYGLRGRNFLLTMRRLARERELLRVVDDQYGAPTWSRLIAEACAQIVAQMKPAIVERMRAASGVYHMTSGGETTWFRFAEALLANDPLRFEQIVKKLEPISTLDYPTAAQRPMCSVLDGTRLYETFGLRLPNWSAALDLCNDTHIDSGRS
jgi:dTDP-4-dehydrorhamnose reductase